MDELAPTLARALAMRRRSLSGTDCFRWLDFEIPGVAVDLYGRTAVVQWYRGPDAEAERALAAALAGSGEIDVAYLKRRHQPLSGKLEDAASRVTSVPLWGAETADCSVHENGATFLIEPRTGLSTGLFLDARDARQWIRRHARGRRVLNAFAYTCAFGVSARQGGAAGVSNVDIARPALEWGVRNYACNHLTSSAMEFVRRDALQTMRGMAKRGERFDLAILDPPPYATSGGSRFVATRDYPGLVAACARILADGGVVLAMCNLAALTETAFKKLVSAGLANSRARKIAAFSASTVDFPHTRALKCLAYEVRTSRATSSIST